MCVAELANKLREMYNNAPKESAVRMIRLFGIKYAADINEGNYSEAEIIKVAGICQMYLNELSKGVELSKYVNPNQL